MAANHLGSDQQVIGLKERINQKRVQEDIRKQLAEAEETERKAHPLFSAREVSDLIKVNDSSVRRTIKKGANNVQLQVTERGILLSMEVGVDSTKKTISDPKVVARSNRVDALEGKHQREYAERRVL